MMPQLYGHFLKNNIFFKKLKKKLTLVIKNIKSTNKLEMRGRFLKYTFNLYSIK